MEPTILDPRFQLTRPASGRPASGQRTRDAGQVYMVFDRDRQYMALPMAVLRGVEVGDVNHLCFQFLKGVGKMQQYNIPAVWDKDNYDRLQAILPTTDNADETPQAGETLRAVQAVSDVLAVADVASRIDRNTTECGIEPVADADCTSGQCIFIGRPATIARHATLRWAHEESSVSIIFSAKSFSAKDRDAPGNPIQNRLVSGRNVWYQKPETKLQSWRNVPAEEKQNIISAAEFSTTIDTTMFWPCLDLADKLHGQKGFGTGPVGQFVVGVALDVIKRFPGGSMAIAITNKTASFTQWVKDKVASIALLDWLFDNPFWGNCIIVATRVVKLIICCMISGTGQEAAWADFVFPYLEAVLGTTIARVLHGAWEILIGCFSPSMLGFGCFTKLVKFILNITAQFVIVPAAFAGMLADFGANMIERFVPWIQGSWVSGFVTLSAWVTGMATLPINAIFDRNMTNQQLILREFLKSTTGGYVFRVKIIASCFVWIVSAISKVRITKLVDSVAKMAQFQGPPLSVGISAIRAVLRHSKSSHQFILEMCQVTDPETLSIIIDTIMEISYWLYDFLLCPLQNMVSGLTGSEATQTFCCARQFPGIK